MDYNAWFQNLALVDKIGGTCGCVNKNTSAIIAEVYDLVPFFN